MLSRSDKLLPVNDEFQVWLASQVDIEFQVWIELQVKSNEIEQIDGSQIQVAPLSICHVLLQPSQLSKFQSSHSSY
jgi:hypothetical protein